MNRHLRVAGLVLLLGVVLGRGVWQQGWAAEQAGNGLKQAGNKLKQLFSTVGASKTISPVPAAAPAPPMATITVTSLADGAANAANCPGASCRLRDAIAKAAPGDTINFSVTGTINLTNNVLSIAKNLTIQGPGAAQLTISGNNTIRVFNISSGFTAALNDLTIANGYGDSDGGGGGIKNTGVLTVTNCKLLGNYTYSNGGPGGGISNYGTLTLATSTLSGSSAGVGGGIYNEGSLTLTNSTLSGNSAAGDGGGIYNPIGAVATIRNSTLTGNNADRFGGGVMMYFGGVTIINSTLSGNSASYKGGGIVNWGNSGSTLYLFNCTITNNSATISGGGAYNYGDTYYLNTIIAGNTATNSDPDVEYQIGGFTSLGHNLVGIKSDAHIFPATGDQQGTPASPINPLLAPLANYGGPTQTHALLPGSTAINAGNNCVLTNTCVSNNLGFNLTTDQRGAGFNRQAGSAVDIGAYEMQHDTPLLAINPATLPAGAVGSAYNQTLSATGGSGNYSFSSSGLLPPGLTLSATGQISGTPTAGGNFSFAVVVRDNSLVDYYGTRTYTITIPSVCTTAPSGLVAWWRAEGNANDTAGSNHGALSGSATISTAAEGQVGRAFKFGGTNGYVALPDNLFPFPTSGTGTTPFSFELWFKSAAGGGVILGQQDVAPYNTVTGNVPAIYVDTDGKLRVEMFWNGAANPLVSDGRVNDNSVFHHLAVSYDGTQQTVYLDGQVMGSRAHTQTAYGASYKYQLGTGNASGWPGGSAANGGWFNFTGLIDEPSLYNRALTAQEVQSLYGSGNAGKCFSCPTINATVAGGGNICSGGSATVTVILTGGVAPYTVTLSNGGGTKSGASPLSFSVSPTAITTYAVQAATDATGCAVGATGSATVTVNSSTAIMTPPAARTVCAGAPVSFSVAAAGTNLSYQWRKGGVAISGATAATYSIASATATYAGSYDVIVTGSCGSVTSSVATLTINAGATISSQPTNQIVCAGSPATFSVAATGTGLSYQWRKGGVAISGATSSSYTLASTTATDAGSYNVVVSSSCGTVTSSAATLTVNNPAAISTQPTNQATCLGGSVTFNVTATGSGLSYQWRKGGVAISGATSSSFTIPSVAAGDVAQYDVVVTGSCGTVISGAASLSINSSTTINTQPADQTICLGAAASFTVAASGTGTLSYQWRKNGTAIGGATGSTYSIPATVAGDAGSYDVVLTSSCGTATSNAATLAFNAAAAITAQPANQTVCVGAPATFSVTAGGTGPFSYQWRKNNVNIAGATASTFKIASTVAGDAAQYDVVVTGSCGSITSSAATLVVNAGGAITAQPTNQTVCAGSPAAFSVTATGSSLTYQWRRNSVNISGATAATYNIASATTANAGSYDVVITSSCGTLTSQAATLTVNAATAISTQPASHNAVGGQSVTFSVTASGANLTYQWRMNGSAISGATGSNYTIASVTAADAGNYDVVVTGTCGSVTSSVAPLTVSNGCATPVVAITDLASGAIYPVGSPVNFSGRFTDASGGIHTATWKFNALTQAGVVYEATGKVSASYTFAQAGVYQVTLTVSNSCNMEGQASTIGELTAIVVIYDPRTGSITGNGSIVSPPGAYKLNPLLTGNATFGLVSKYKKGASVPTGVTQLQFALANLTFRSTDFEWLIAIGPGALYQGSGTINNAGDYQFILTVIDGQISGGGGQDIFRIRIWDNQGRGLIYDNQLNPLDITNSSTSINGGKIVFRTNGNNGNGNNLAALAALADDEINGEGQLRDEEAEWQISLGGEGGQQSVLRGGSGAPYFDILVPGDYDGDGKTDFALFRRAKGQWLIKRSTDGGLTQLHWGLGADLPVAADYDGDGKTDIAVWRGATGQWFILRSSDGAKQVIVWGAGLAPFNDQPASADYDGDGKADVAVWRAAEGKWYALGSASNSVLTKTVEPPATANQQ